MTPDDDVSFDHLDRMSDHRGLFEHAEGTERREQHGYCTDDNARMLVVTSREPDVGAAHRLSRLALQFVRSSQDVDGQCHNRMDTSGRWTDSATTDDCWGRSLLGFGVAAAHHTNPSIRRWAMRAFDKGARHRSHHPRSMVFAALGAAEIAAIDHGHTQARSLLSDMLAMIGPIPSGPWAWPEPRLAYANASIAEAVMAAGAALGRPADVERGLAMLGWLLDLETRAGYLSVTGVGGRSPGDEGPQFDQQPIEVAAMADACWRANAITGEHRWSGGIAAAAAWFTGDNDARAVMFDAASGGGFDGLHADGVNINEGAESTLAFISTMQRARSFVAAP